MASSSSQPRSSVSTKLYDVFISHRGPDVKDTLAKQLYDLLKARDCKAFLDREEIEGGDSIPSAIHNAICTSRVQIAVFSKGYAESSWCLDELVLMLKQTDTLFIPVFYGVKPGELRHIENKSQYAAAFYDFRSKGRHLDKLDEWKQALASSANRSGYEHSIHQEDLCEKIVSRVLQEMEKRRPLYVAKYPVGLDEIVQDFLKSCPETAQTVGIYGLGGIGKSTLARELFNRKRSTYSASCFLSDVRESHARQDLHSLQSQLFKDLFTEKWSCNSVYEGIEKLKDNLRRAAMDLNSHFFVVLDDIDHQDQLAALLPEGKLGSGSLVIITTRDQSVLRGVDFCYKMKGMDEYRAKALFCSHAFRGRAPPTQYERLVESFVEFCGGLPLSLIVLGAHVYDRDEHYWELDLEKVKKIQPKDIMQRLKISFDGLDTEEQQIFIDIACFFNKNSSRLVTNAMIIWKASGWSDEHALQTLKDKCLVDVNQYRDTFEMHDHLRDLGRHMAEKLGSPRLWRPKLLRSMEAKGFERILADTKDRCFHSYSDSSLQRRVTYFIAEAHLLWLRMSPIDGKSKISIPSWIPLHKLQILEVWNVSELWSGFHQHLQTNSQASFELRRLLIANSPSLLKLPDLIEMFSNLEELIIRDSLEKTDAISFEQSLKQLRNLRSLQLLYGYWSRTGLYRGRFFNPSRGRDSSNFNSSTSSRLDGLETIELNGLSHMYKLVISGEMCPTLRSLVVKEMKDLKEMELNQLQSLNTLEVEGCPLETISRFKSLTGLRTFRVSRCLCLESLPSLAPLCRLEDIMIEDCPELKGVEGVEDLPRLKSMMIDMSERGYAWVRNYIHGLRKLPVKEICLIHGEVAERWVSSSLAVDRASCQLNANLFSEVIGAEAVSEIESRWDDELQIESSSSAITVYALLTSTSYSDLCLYKGEDIYSQIHNSSEPQIFTLLLNQHDSEWRLVNVRLVKGYKATVKVGEEEKALTVLQRIVDLIYKLKLGVIDDMGM